MQYRVTFKERFYFLLMATIGIASYIGIGSQLLHLFRGLDHTTAPLIYIYSVYLALVIIYVFVFQPLWLKGFLIGHAIKITEKQFPLYSAVIKEQAALLNLKNVPNAYMIQTGGMLNAFATRILRKNYIVLHSAILEHALKEGQGELEFIIGHELGHLKRNHVSFFWHLVTLPAMLVPFLFKAYSRAREYTCDHIGYVLAPIGAEKGILLLAAGRQLANQINLDDLIENYKNDRGFSSWFFEICSTHPLTVKRLIALNKFKLENL